MIYENKYAVETWLEMPNFENYEISSFGKLKNKITQKVSRGSIKKDHDKDTKTRVIYSLTKDKVRYRIYAARLVASAFLNFDLNIKTLVVDHIDNNSMNDSVENLQVITNRENLTKDRQNKHGYTGVSKNRYGYTAYISVNSHQKYLGTYKTAHFAHEAYLIALSDVNRNKN